MSVAQIIQKGVSTLNSITRGQSRYSTTTGTTGTIGTDTNFLDLLVSQITHQNPMEPMDNEQMVTQLTQFQTLEKLDNLNESMGSLITYQNMMNSINLLGKEVAVNDPSTGSQVTGTVDGIKIMNGFPGVVVNNKFYDFNYVVGIK